jgi:hypothetical protein
MQGKVLRLLHLRVRALLKRNSQPLKNSQLKKKIVRPMRKLKPSVRLSGTNLMK